MNLFLMDYFRKTLFGIFLGVGSSCVSVDKDLEELRQDYDLSEEVRIDRVCFDSSEKEKGIRDYVESNLEKIMRAQERKLKIKHYGAPGFACSLPEGYPNPFCQASYNCVEDKIYLNSDNLSLDEIRVSFIGGVLNHELGHFYSDKLSENFLGRDWPVKFSNHEEYIGGRLIAEGIAEYFRIKTTFSRDAFWPDEFPDNLNAFDLNENFYSIGLSLTNPILEIHGSNGMVHLMENFPHTLDEVLNLEDYQKRILEGLEVSE